MKRIPWFILALLALAPASRAEEKPDGELSLPWSAFERLLKLDKDDVHLPWEDFQRLLKQTGVKETPPFQVQNGLVTLSRAEFRKLLDSMKPPAGEGGKSYLTQALYSGRVGRKGANLTARIRVHVTHEGGPYTAVRVPLFRDSLAFEDIRLDGRPALVENDGGQTLVVIPQPGEHEVTAAFSLPAALDKEPYRLGFNVPGTPITQVDLLLAAPNLDARVDGAAQVETSPAEGGTRVRASLPQTQSIGIAWNAVEPEKAKGPAKVYAAVRTLLSVHDDAVRATARVELEVLQNSINNLTLQTPEGYAVLDVTGEAVGDWKRRGEGERALFVPFSYSRKGRLDVVVRMERVFKEKGGVVPFDGIQVLGSVRESGELAVEKLTNAEVKVVDTAGLVRLDPQETAPSLRGLSSQVLLDAFKYIRPPFRLGLDIQKHEELAVVSSVIDTANAVTLLLKDGKCVTHVTYSVRNAWKQFLELGLPPGADVWTVFVEGRPVKASRGEKGVTLIPLNRSRSDGSGLAAFDVEVMYFQSLGRGLAGRDSLALPMADLKTSQLIWSAYLPTERDYVRFGGTMDPEEQAEGVTPLAQTLLGNRRILQGMSLSAGEYEKTAQRGNREVRLQSLDKARASAQYRLKSRFDDSQGVDESAFAQQVEREVAFFSNVNETLAGKGGAGTPGFLPVRIKIPNSGQLYRFTKVLVQEQEPATIHGVYLRHVLVQALGVALWMGLIGLLWYFRRALSRAWGQLTALIARHPRVLGWFKTPAAQAGAAFLAFIFFTVTLVWYLAVLAFLAFLAALGRWGWIELKKRRTVQ